MTSLNEDWAKLARDHRQEVASLIELLRKTGEALESSEILKEARRAGNYVQMLDQLITQFVQIESLADGLRKRAWRQDPRKDPESVKLTEELEKTCKGADRLLGRLADISVDWTLDESIGSSTGLADHLHELRPQEINDVFGDLIDGSLEDMVDEYLDELTRRSYDFRPTLLRRRPSLKERQQHRHR